MKSLTWMDSALCAQTAPEIFFPEGAGQNTNQAKKICASCPVRTECGEHAQSLEGDLFNGLRHGAWGGMSAVQRAAVGGPRRNAVRDETVIRLTERGMSPAQIAAQLDISDRTVARVKATRKDTAA